MGDWQKLPGYYCWVRFDRRYHLENPNRPPKKSNVAPFPPDGAAERGEAPDSAYFVLDESGPTEGRFDISEQSFKNAEAAVAWIRDDASKPFRHGAANYVLVGFGNPEGDRQGAQG